jgi:hypothetical protein
MSTYFLAIPVIIWIKKNQSVIKSNLTIRNGPFS